MSYLRYLTSFKTSFEAVYSWIDQQLTLRGFIIKPSFDLQVARAVHTDCPCPHHGTNLCDCQIVVLLVYKDQAGPITLVIHSQDGVVYLSIEEVQDSEKESEEVGKIIHTLGHQNINLS